VIYAFKSYSVDLIHFENPRDTQIYLDSLKDGHEVYRHIRVIFVGDAGVGKTSVCKRLQNKKFDEHEKSTNGAEIFIQVFEVDLSADEMTWKLLDDNHEQRIINRFGDVIAENKGSQGMFVSSTNINTFPRAIT